MILDIVELRVGARNRRISVVAACGNSAKGMQRYGYGEKKKKADKILFDKWSIAGTM